VQVAAVEAGLGGRLDATNVMPSRVTVLTSIGLDHTEWLGESELEIASEKLAVLRDQSTLVLGRVDPDVLALAKETAASRGARVVQAPAEPGPEVVLGARGEFQRRNFALAAAAVEQLLGALDEQRLRAVAADIQIPGRLEALDGEPPTLVDAAHNAAGAEALAEALPAIAGQRPIVVCLAILADKDAEAMTAALAPVLDYAVCTQLSEAALRGTGRPGSRPWPAPDLATLLEAVGIEAEAETDPQRALARAREQAALRGGIALVVGSHYLAAIARGE
jgi:dihydrofolate synthase/folylpolyglutamate synthase